MKTTDNVLEVVRDWVAAAGGLVSKDDLRRLESRLDEIEELLEALEERIEERG